MKKPDRFLFNCLFGLVIPILCFLIFWWGSLLITRNETVIMFSAISGLIFGLTISLLLKLTFKPDVYRLSGATLILIYLFYNIGMFGFFMGVPVFNLVLGIIAGFYWVKRLIYRNEPVDFKTEIYRVSLFSSMVTGVICLLSATVALMSESTPSDLKGMLHLPFNISHIILIGFIVTGGLFLIFIQYYLVRITMHKTFQNNNIDVR